MNLSITHWSISSIGSFAVTKSSSLFSKNVVSFFLAIVFSFFVIVVTNILEFSMAFFYPKLRTLLYTIGTDIDSRFLKVDFHTAVNAPRIFSITGSPMLTGMKISVPFFRIRMFWLSMHCFTFKASTSTRLQPSSAGMFFAGFL